MPDSFATPPTLSFRVRRLFGGRGICFFFSDCAKVCLVLFAALALSAIASYACEKIPGEREVPPTFTVLVADAGRPVSGIPIRIKPKSKLRPASPREGISDAAGKWLVEHLDPGEYEISVGYGTGFESLAYLKVFTTPTAQLRETIKFGWLGNSILQSNHLHGILKNDAPLADTQKNQNARHPSMARAKIVVQDARTLAPVAEVVTDSDARFDLKDLAPGTYRVQIKPSDAPDSANYFPLVITAGENASADPVELSVVFTSCGLYFSTRPLSR